MTRGSTRATTVIREHTPFRTVTSGHEYTSFMKNSCIMPLVVDIGTYSSATSLTSNCGKSDLNRPQKPVMSRPGQRSFDQSVSWSHVSVNANKQVSLCSWKLCTSASSSSFLPRIYWTLDNRTDKDWGKESRAAQGAAIFLVSNPKINATC